MFILNIKKSRKNKSLATFRNLWDYSVLFRALSEEYLIHSCAIDFLTKKPYRNSTT